MFPIKQLTSFADTFFAYDAAGNPVTGKVDGDWTKSISKGGSLTFSAMTVTITEISLGFYGYTLSTSHTDTLGTLSLAFSATGALQVNMKYRVEARTLDDLAFPTTSGRNMDIDAAGGVEVGSFQAGAITAAAIADGAIDRAAFAADTGLQTIRSFTAQDGGSNYVTLDSGASATDDIYNDVWYLITGGTGVGQPPRRVVSYKGATKVAIVHKAFTTNPDSTTTGALIGIIGADVRASASPKLVIEAVRTLATGENNPHGTLFARGKWWIGDVLSPAKLHRVDPVALTYDTVTFASDGNHVWASYVVYSATTDRIYVLFNGLSGTIFVSEVHPDTLAVTDVINDSTGAFSGGALVELGGSLYIGSMDGSAVVKIHKYNTSTFTRDASTAALTGASVNLHGMATDGVYVYASLGNGNRIYKVTTDLATVTNTGPISNVTNITDDMTIAGGYLWAGVEVGTAIGNVIRVLLSDVTVYTVLKTGIDAACYGVSYAMGYVWALYAGTPAAIVQISPETSELWVHRMPTSSGYNDINELVSDGQHLLVTFYLSPGKLARLSFGAAEIPDKPANFPSLAIDRSGNVIPQDSSISLAKLASDTDVYAAKVWLTDDDTGTTDRYAVAWYKNGQLVTSGITSPLIQVYKIADGTDLVASTAMTQIGSKGTYRYTEGTNRIVNGVGYMIQTDATIGGSNRTSVQPFGRPTS